MTHTSRETLERDQSVSSADSPFQTPAESPTKDFVDVDPFCVPAGYRHQQQRPELLSSWQTGTPTIPELLVNGSAAEDNQTEHEPGPNSIGQTSVSTTNKDHGLQEPASDQSSLTEVDLTVGIGTGLQQDQGQRLQEVDLSNSQSSLPPEQNAPFTSRSPERTNSLGLQQQLYEALVKSTHEDEKEFLPVDAQKRILGRLAVSTELVRKGFPPTVVESLTQEIWDKSKYNDKEGHEKLRSRRRIFIVLVMMGQVPMIQYFIDNDIWDPDLPFSRATNNMYLLSEGSNPKQIRCFQSSSQGALQQLVRLFAQYQWHLLAPKFQLSDGVGSPKKVLHYVIKNPAILPFIEKRSMPETPSGFGLVRAVRIHPAHHNHHDRAKNPWFAIKELHTRRKEEFDEEVKSLKRMFHTDNEHLIKLLVTYEYRESWYLLFPYADNNLRDFWRESFPTPERCYSRALWVARQCAGLVQGVSDIHFHKPTKALKQQLNVSQHDRNWGRHGDLKPENILWFRKSNPDQQEEDDMGILKITDFGLSRFHGKSTIVENHPAGFPTSPTYRAPEYERFKILSPEYDIWSLGCVLLEFVIWYHRGWEGVDKFSEDRVEDDDNEIQGDTYFQIVTISTPKPDDIGGRLKLSVERWIMELRGDPQCSRFFQELLDYIHRSMLRIRTEKRFSSKAISEKIKAMAKKCEDDEEYCAAPHPQPTPKKRSNTSSILLQVAAPVELSPETKEEIREKGKAPQHTGKLEDTEDGAPESPCRTPSPEDALNVSHTGTEVDQSNAHLTTGGVSSGNIDDRRLSIMSSEALAHDHSLEHRQDSLPDGATPSSPASSSRSYSFQIPDSVHRSVSPTKIREPIEEYPTAGDGCRIPSIIEGRERRDSNSALSMKSSRKLFSSQMQPGPRVRRDLMMTPQESTITNQSRTFSPETSSNLGQGDQDTPNTTQRSGVEVTGANAPCEEHESTPEPQNPGPARSQSDELQETGNMETRERALEQNESAETATGPEEGSPRGPAKSEELRPSGGYQDAKQTRRKTLLRRIRGFAKKLRCWRPDMS